MDQPLGGFIPAMIDRFFAMARYGTMAKAPMMLWTHRKQQGHVDLNLVFVFVVYQKLTI